MPYMSDAPLNNLKRSPPPLPLLSIHWRCLARKFGWDCEFVDVDDTEAVAEALAHPRVKALWCESLANPGGVVSDLRTLGTPHHITHPVVNITFQ